MRVISLDIGMARTGYAFGNTEIGVALTRSAVLLTQDLEKFLKQENKAEKIDIIVVGLPTNRNSEATSMTEFVKQKINLIRIWMPEVKVLEVNEKATSRLADQHLRLAVKSTQKYTGFNDNEAARIILQEYLDQP